MSHVTYTCTLDVDRQTVEFVSRQLAAHRRTLGTRTRTGTRALSPFKQAVLLIRWFLNATRVAQLATDNRIGKSTVYAYLHEGIDILAARAPDLAQALTRAEETGLSHLNLDGTVVRTDRVRTPGPSGADLWWSGKHKHHGANVQVLSAPDGWPLWTSGVRPGREHDTTCAKAVAGLLPALEKMATDQDLLTLTDLGYENLSAAMRHPAKKPAGGELTHEQKTYNQLIRGVHGVAERANSLLKTTFKALRRVSLDPGASARSPAPAWSCSSSNTAAPPDPTSPTVTNRCPERLSPDDLKRTRKDAWQNLSRSYTEAARGETVVFAAEVSNDSVLGGDEIPELRENPSVGVDRIQFALPMPEQPHLPGEIGSLIEHDEVRSALVMQDHWDREPGLDFLRKEGLASDTPAPICLHTNWSKQTCLRIFVLNATRRWGVCVA